MALIEELSRQGETLFKYRSHLPIPFAIIGISLNSYQIYFFNKEEHSLFFEIICLIIGLIGLVIRAITLGYTPKGTSGRNTKNQVAEKLNTKGMYSVIRNPLYLGNFFMWFSLIILININWLSLLFILLFWIYYERIIFAEEFFLRNKYGKLFSDWSSKTPLFFPRFNRWEKPNLSFSIKKVLKQEYSSFFALFFCFSFFNGIENLVREKIFYLNKFWLYSLVLSGIITLILKFLKNRTKVLHVKGR